ncbi:MAG: sugar phosphate nucleotidyltransferase [Candidatus Margulisiibacteriota bacterium]|nr:sugar phosphate nucleotidyltransferase [Candidatus Margulisiibacteriota bacterium]
MKGVILAGGTGSRLFPLTKVTNKHLLPVGNQPMIFYPVNKMIQAGIKDILIVTGVEHMGDVVQLLGSGKEYGCHFTYRVQEEAGGIAQALLLAESFANNEPITVILGDNIFQNSIKPFVEAFKGGAHLLLKTVHDPERFGVATLNGDFIETIIEKPKNPTSNLAVTGVYMYDQNVFNIIRLLKPSQRGELEISDVNAHYLKNHTVTYSKLKGWWSDAGTFDSLAKASSLVANTPVD